MKIAVLSSLILGALLGGCTPAARNRAAPAVQPVVITAPVQFDTDDPAFWIHPTDRSQSLILGTDKDTNGALYAFDLDGKIVQRVGGLKRPNNVDVAYGLSLGGKPVDLAVVTEREMQRLRVFALPDFRPLDRGDLLVFGGDTQRAPMGIALYTRPRDRALFAFVGGKSGPAEGYLGQYRLEDDGTGHVKMALVRQFGRYSGKKEIESIAVDAELGYVYYSDETFGVRKYAADPDAPDASRELATIGTSGYASDHEGISIYKINDGTGYLLVSDQQANQFRIYKREGEPGRPHEHPLVKTVPVAAIESDGSEVTSAVLSPKFPSGLFVAMTNGKVFHYYSWDDLAGTDLKRAPNALLLSGGAAPRSGPVPLPRAHAHNDYLHARPLLDALDRGFCSVEADVHLVDGRLLVAHDRKDVRPERTLEALYLEPLRERVRQNGGRVYHSGPPLILLIDVKSEAAPAYAALNQALQPYAAMLTVFRGTSTAPGAVTVIISGNRAREIAAAQPERLAALDGRRADFESHPPPNLVPLVSENWNNHFTSRWEGPLPADENQALRRWVERAHAQGRTVRFWNTPDRPDVWEALAEAGVDLIGTDDLAGLQRFFERRQTGPRTRTP